MHDKQEQVDAVNWHRRGRLTLYTPHPASRDPSRGRNFVFGNSSDSTKKQVRRPRFTLGLVGVLKSVYGFNVQSDTPPPLPHPHRGPFNVCSFCKIKLDNNLIFFEKSNLLQI